MIVVVADTSPLNYLIQINCDHVLPALYERVFLRPQLSSKSSVILARSQPYVHGYPVFRHGSWSSKLTKRPTDDWRDLILESAKLFNWPHANTPTCC